MWVHKGRKAKKRKGRVRKNKQIICGKLRGNNKNDMERGGASKTTSGESKDTLSPGVRGDGVFTSVSPPAVRFLVVNSGNTSGQQHVFQKHIQ
jgi:hypothetical protein